MRFSQQIFQEVAYFTFNENGDSSEIQGGYRSSRCTDGIGTVLLHFLILKHTKIFYTARSRLKRWRSKPNTVYMNGRFGMYRHCPGTYIDKHCCSLRQLGPCNDLFVWRTRSTPFVASAIAMDLSFSTAYFGVLKMFGLPHHLHKEAPE